MSLDLAFPSFVSRGIYWSQITIGFHSRHINLNWSKTDKCLQTKMWPCHNRPNHWVIDWSKVVQWKRVARNNNVFSRSIIMLQIYVCTEFPVLVNPEWAAIDCLLRVHRSRCLNLEARTMGRMVDQVLPEGALSYLRLTKKQLCFPRHFIAQHLSRPFNIKSCISLTKQTSEWQKRPNRNPLMTTSSAKRFVSIGNLVSLTRFARAPEPACQWFLLLV